MLTKIRDIHESKKSIWTYMSSKGLIRAWVQTTSQQIKNLRQLHPGIYGRRIVKTKINCNGKLNVKTQMKVGQVITFKVQ